MSRRNGPAIGVFLILLGSYAFFWHSRDWNTASRLMLTYAMVDRGTVSITGLDQQTGDKAKYRGQFYSDKLPGYPFLAALPYACARWAFGMPPHPLGVPGMKYWAPDYWITLTTSGLLTACTGALLVLMARDMGCRPWGAMLVGLAYGLSTPAYVYATLAYGHQSSAFALLASFRLIEKKVSGWERLRLTTAGFLTAGASVIELQMGPVSAILALYLLVEVMSGRHTGLGLGCFAMGALIPTLALLGYNQAAFDSPLRMGYFYHVNFNHVHTPNNPLGLTPPDWSRFGPLLWGRYRGLFSYAPILILSLPGWIVLVSRRSWSLAIVSFLSCAAVLLVNLSYPEWTGGWSTGPRLLVPLIPFAMIPVAGLLGMGGRWRRALMLVAAILAVIGGIEMLLFQGAGGRIPNEVWDVVGWRKVPLAEPLRDAVWPLWTGEARPPERRYVDGFALNLVDLASPDWVERLTPPWRFLQMMPLVAVQIIAITALSWLFLRRSKTADDSAGMMWQRPRGCERSEPEVVSTVLPEGDTRA
jgi:hypothetical protein